MATISPDSTVISTSERMVNSRPAVQYRFVRPSARMIGLLGSILSIAILPGCDGHSEPEVVPQARDEGSATDGRPAVRVVFVGTSLTEGYGLSGPDDAYPARLQALADSAGWPVRIVNAGVSGETSAGALARMDWILSRPADIVALEVGANDGLRGLDPSELAANLEAIVDRVTDRLPDASILLLPMQAPPNMGREYTERFRDAYRGFETDPRVAFGPFLLDGVAGVRDLNQADGIHPTAEGHRRMAGVVWEVLGPLLEDVLEDRGIHHVPRP